MTNIDRVRIAMEKYDIGSVFSRSEIIEIVQNEFPLDSFSKNSIMPSDYCYNRTNEDKLQNKKLLDFNIFEYIDKSVYKYLGENFAYNNDIIHHPKFGRPYVIGYWRHGVRTLKTSK